MGHQVYLILIQPTRLWPAIVKRNLRVMDSGTFFFGSSSVCYYGSIITSLYSIARPVCALGCYGICAYSGNSTRFAHTLTKSTNKWLSDINLRRCLKGTHTIQTRIGSCQCANSLSDWRRRGGCATSSQSREAGRGIDSFLTLSKSCWV
jgi:hypothetical protein